MSRTSCEVLPSELTDWSWSIPVGSRKWLRRKGRVSRPKRACNVDFCGDFSRPAPFAGVLPWPIGQSRLWPRDLRNPRNTPSRGLEAHMISYMGHKSATERIFIAWGFRDHKAESISIADWSRSPTGVGCHSLVCHRDVVIRVINSDY